MKKIKVITSLLCAVFLVIGSVAAVSAAQVDFTNYNGDIDNIQYAGSVKNQGENGDCILYALTSAAESYALKNDSDTQRNKNFSVEILENSISSKNEFSKIIKECREVPFSDDDAYYYISSCTEIDVNIGTIKKAVYENGAAVIAFGVSSDMSNEACYSPENAAFYDNGGTKNHAVSVIGWDDGYSKDNFASKPESDGAWLCQNSYGEEYGKNGFFYLSYCQRLESAAKLELNYDNGDGTETKISPAKDENGGIERVVSVNMTADKNGCKIAYADIANGKTLKCSFKKDFTSGLYVVRLPENPGSLYYFDDDTVVFFNGDILNKGITGSNETEYEIASENTIHIASKEIGGFAVTEIKLPKYDLGYIRLTYDDGSETLIFENSFAKKGITVTKNEVGDNSKTFGELREVEKCEYYSEITFDNTYAFSDETKISAGQKSAEYTVNEAETPEENGTGFVFVTRSLTAEISQQGIIGKIISAFFSIFGKLAFVINH